MNILEFILKHYKNTLTLKNSCHYPLETILTLALVGSKQDTIIAKFRAVIFCVSCEIAVVRHVIQLQVSYYQNIFDTERSRQLYIRLR